MIKYVVGLCVGIVICVAVLVYPGYQPIPALLAGILVGFCGVRIVIERGR
ncbi:hypothetical protein LCGC14_2130530 [marine sediment metagenome]|uniref:Uncharacterized protein n=1 Tax=marine sediment metagenome TaxID=412755 RepID=A0A0F9ENR8_9ZZZZ